MLWISLAQASVLRHALIVGANEGGGSLEPLHYAEEDAQRMADVLVELGGFDPAYVTVLYAPTPEELREAIHEHSLFSENFDEDLFLFFYSGHADARGLRLGEDLYPFDSLKADVRAMPADVKLGILDACRSGTITRLKGAAVSTPFLEEQELLAEGEAWMTASSADESAQESDSLRGSFFTHYLVSGLRGAADEGADGEISLDEAYRYAFDRVVDQTGATDAGTQHPNFDYHLKGQGDLELTHVANARATLLVPSELVGTLLVLRLPDRTPIAEVSKQEGQSITLALPPGTYSLRLSNGKEVREAVVGLYDGSRVTASHWAPVGLQSVTAKGTGVVQDAQEWARLGVATGQQLIHTVNLQHSPVLAGGASTALPGAGQFYNGQWGRGAFYLGSFSILMGSSLISNPDPASVNGLLAGPDVLRLSALMLYGASIADAAHTARPSHQTHPERGVALSTQSGWTFGNPWFTPSIAGISIDVPMSPHLSIGADRLGWTRAPLAILPSGAVQTEGIVGVGSRLDLYLDGDHLRPGVFAAVGFRVHLPDDLAENPAVQAAPVVGGGAALRWYVTPRYFVQWETRLESDGGPAQFQFGGGFGVHLGS